MKKKGQAAMEFLMTYGWAIVVVLAAIGALAYFGVLSPNKLLPDRTTFTTPLPNVDNAVVSQGGAFTQIVIAFKNNKGVAIQIPSATSITSSQCSSAFIDHMASSTTGAPINFNTSIQNGDGFVITWNCTTTGTQTVGNKIKADLTFDYINAETLQAIKQTGSVEGKYS